MLGAQKESFQGRKGRGLNLRRKMFFAFYRLLKVINIHNSVPFPRFRDMREEACSVRPSESTKGKTRGRRTGTQDLGK